jgi:hypothetical protein
MTLQRCNYTGVVLPDNVTCGALCSSFPSCLPASPLYLLGQVARLSAEAAADYRDLAASVQALQVIREALGGIDG